MPCIVKARGRRGATGGDRAGFLAAWVTRASFSLDIRSPLVIAGLDPAIHQLEKVSRLMDARVKPAHDDEFGGSTSPYIGCAGRISRRVGRAKAPFAPCHPAILPTARSHWLRTPVSG